MCLPTSLSSQHHRCRAVAEKMNDELVLQDKMLSDLDSKTDKTQTKLDAVNE